MAQSLEYLSDLITPYELEKLQVAVQQQTGCRINPDQLVSVEWIDKMKEEYMNEDNFGENAHFIIDEANDSYKDQNKESLSYCDGMIVRIELLETSQPIVMYNISNTYTKGNLYCVYDGHEVTKFPMCNIFRIKESY